MPPALLQLFISLTEQLLPVIITKIKSGTPPEQVTLTAAEVEAVGNVWLAQHTPLTTTTTLHGVCEVVDSMGNKI